MTALEQLRAAGWDFRLDADGHGVLATVRPPSWSEQRERVRATIDAHRAEVVAQLAAEARWRAGTWDDAVGEAIWHEVSEAYGRAECPTRGPLVALVEAIDPPWRARQPDPFERACRRFIAAVDDQVVARPGVANPQQRVA